MEGLNTLAYKQEIEKILDYCTNTVIDSEEILSFVLIYSLRGKISYIDNLMYIANYLKRNPLTIFNAIKPLGLKHYTLPYKNEIHYGLILTNRLKEQIQKNLEKYIDTLKCVNCISRFTQYKDNILMCISCGHIVKQ